MKIRNEDIVHIDRATGEHNSIPAPINNESDSWTEFVLGHLQAIRNALDCLERHMQGKQE